MPLQQSPAPTYFIFNFLLDCRFWGTCAEHARQLHRYTHSSVVCCFHPPITHIWHFSPCYPSLTSPPPMLSLPCPPNRPLCVIFPSCVHCSHCSTPTCENMQCFIFRSCVSLLRIVVSRFIRVPKNDMNSSFFMAA